MGDSLVDNQNSFLFTSRLNAEGGLKAGIREMIIQQAGPRRAQTLKGNFLESSIKQAAVERSVIQKNSHTNVPSVF